MIIHLKGDVIEIRGSVLENQWLALQSAVRLGLKEHPNGVVIDGSGLTDVTQAGARTFVDASNYIQAHRTRVVVSGLPESVLDEIRRIPGVRSQLPLAASIEEARASLAVGGIEAVPEVRRRPAVLVPLLGAWHRAVEFAAIQADTKAEIHLLYPIEVPRTLPLGVPLPEKEQEATQTLAEAERTLAGRAVTVRKLATRCRVATEGVARFTAEAKPRLVVIAYPKSELVQETLVQSMADILCQESPSEVVVLCVGQPAAPTETPTVPGKSAILVPLIGAWPRAVELAAHTAGKKAEVQLLYVIEVPRRQPLDIPLPDEEREAQQTLAEAEQMLRGKRVAPRKLAKRVRDTMEGVAAFAAESGARLLVLSYFKKELAGEASRHKIVHTFCHEATYDTAIYCVPE